MKYRNLIVGQAVMDSFLLPYTFFKKESGLKRFQKNSINQSLLKNSGVTSGLTDQVLITFEALQFNDVLQFEKFLEKRLKRWAFSFPSGVGLTALKSTIKSFLGLNFGVNSIEDTSLVRVPIISLYYALNDIKRHEFVTAAIQATHSNQEVVAASLGLSNFIAYVAKNEKLPSVNELKSITLKMHKQDSAWRKQVDILALHLNSPLSVFLKAIDYQNGFKNYAIQTAIACIWFIYKTKQPPEVFKLLIQFEGSSSLGSIIGALIGLLNQKSLTPELQNYSFKLQSSSKDVNELSKDFLTGLWYKLFVKNFSLLFLLLPYRFKGIFRSS